MLHIKNYNFLAPLKILILAFLFSFSLNVVAELNGKEIMQKVQNQNRIYKNQKFDVFMRIVDRKKRARTRYFSSWKKYETEKSYGLVRFYKPVNLKNTSMLSVMEEREDVSNQWLYLPAFRNVKKLSSEDKNKSFMGSDFTNSDMGGRTLNSDIHKLIAKNKKYYIVESTPKSKADNYARIRYKILRKFMIPKSIQFFDHDDKLIKVLRNDKIRKHKKMYIVVQSQMSNPNTKSKTYIKVNKINTDVTKSISFFSTRGLRQ